MVIYPRIASPKNIFSYGSFAPRGTNSQFLAHHHRNNDSYKEIQVLGTLVHGPLVLRGTSYTTKPEKKKAWFLPKYPDGLLDLTTPYSDPSQGRSRLAFQNYPTSVYAIQPLNSTRTDFEATLNQPK